MVIVIVSFMMLMVMSAFQEIAKGQGVNIATRNLASKMILARSFAINNRQYVAILIPQCGGYPSSGIPTNYYNRSYRACIVGKSSGNYYFKRWVPGENWEFPPTGVAILEMDASEGVFTTNGRLTPSNTNPTTVSPSAISPNPKKGINCSDINGGSNAVIDCAAIIFKPSGKAVGNGARYIEIGEGVYSGGAMSLIMTNPSPDAYLTININQHTGRVAYEKGP